MSVAFHFGRFTTSVLTFLLVAAAVAGFLLALTGFASVEATAP